MTARKNDDGVSVIVGTLLLILITVTAAAGLAVMISQMQKDAMDRQAHITAVQNEQLLITGVNFVASPTDWDTYFPPPNGTLNQSYSSVIFSLTNLNNQDSKVIGISFNDIYAHNATETNSNSNPAETPYNFSSTDPSSSLVVPASASMKFRINFTTDFSFIPSSIGPDDQVKVLVMTSMYNTFEKTFQPPNPVIVPSTATQNMGNVQRNVLVLDGSQSFAANNNTIIDWNWSLQDASGTNPLGNCTDSADLGPQNITRGKTVQFQPKSPGPFCVNLTVQDNNGMKKSSDYVEIPENDMFVPPANFNAVFVSNPPANFINVTITDINGKGVNNAVINYILGSNQFGNLTLDNYVGVTGINGMNSSNVTSGVGSVKVTYGNFAPIEIAVRGSS